MLRTFVVVIVPPLPRPQLSFRVNSERHTLHKHEIFTGREKTREGKRKICKQLVIPRVMLRADSHEMTVMKRLSLSYRSCPEVVGMFPGHPRLHGARHAVGPSSDKGDMSPWPSQQQGQSEPPGRGSCPLPAVRGRSPTESSRAEDQKLAKFTAAEKHLPSLFLIKHPTLTLGLQSTI